MPKIYLLKKLNPQDSISKHYPEDDFVRWVGDDEEEARKNAPRGSLPRNKAISMSPWLNKEQTSCELEYNSEQDGVAGVPIRNTLMVQYGLRASTAPRKNVLPNKAVA